MLFRSHTAGTKVALNILVRNHGDTAADKRQDQHFADKVVLLDKQVLCSGTPAQVLASQEFADTFHLRMGKGGDKE